MKAKHKILTMKWCFIAFCILTMLSVVSISWAASISGTIYDNSTTPSPLPFVSAQLLTPERQWLGRGSCSDQNGFFAIPDIPEGKYILLAGGGWPCGSPINPIVYAQTFYTQDEKGTYDPHQAFVFDLGASDNKTGKNFHLVLGATISGNVTVSQGTGLGNVNVGVSPVGIDNWGYGGCTDSYGDYSVIGLPPGSYRVSAGGQNWCGGQLYKQVFYNNKLDWNLADLITLSVGQTQTGINFSNLTLDAAISGNVFGHPVMGIQGINVVLHDSLERLVNFQEVGDWGGYYFGGLTPGERYTVKVYDPFLRYQYAERGDLVASLGSLITADFTLTNYVPSGTNLPSIKNPMAYVIHSPDGRETLQVSAEVEDPSGCQPSSIKSVIAIGPGIGPNGRPHRLYYQKFQALVDRGMSYGEFWVTMRDNEIYNHLFPPLDGNYTISALDVEGNRATVTVSLDSYTPYKLAIPTLKNPVDRDPDTPGFQVDPNNLTLSWEPVGGAESYTVRIMHLGERIWKQNTTGTSCPIPLGILSEGRWYSWNIMAYDNTNPEQIDYASVSETRNFFTIGGVTPPSETLSVQIVPWVPGSPLIPHDAYAGHQTTLKAVAKGGTPPYTYTWDFGDGSFPVTAPVTDRYNLEAFHSYPSGSDALYEARITVTDSSGATASAIYPVRFWANPSRGVKVNVAIDDALWWLHKNMNRFTSDGIDYGQLSPGSNPAGSTALALQAWVLNGHSPDGDPNNPYVEDAIRAKNYILGHLHPIYIGSETVAGNTRNPDSNDNGKGLYVKNGHRMYETGLVLMALATLKDQSLTTTIQDLVDYLSYAQVEPDVGGGRGGWRYDTNYRESDMSVTQFPLIGLEAAEYHLGFSVTIPSYVKEELKNNFLYFIQNKSSGGFGYSWPNNWVNVAKTGAGLVGLALTEIPYDDLRAQMALDFINREWGRGDRDSSGSPYYNIGDLYAMYAVMKGMKSYELKGKNTQYIGPHDWYNEYATWEIENQYPNGKWQSPVNSYGSVVDTTFGVLILLPQIFSIGPTAIAQASPTSVEVGQPVTFDHSGSFHRDTTKTIVSYEWDFNGDGVVDWSTSNGTDTHQYYYGSPGTYTATLTVTDNTGVKDTDQVSITVSPIVSPIQVSIRIEPETLNLSSKGVFTAFITLPGGYAYTLSDIDPATLVCEGAGVKQTNIAAKKFIAKFNTQDLVGVPTGDKVTLTVTGNFKDGTPFKGSDSIRVIKKK